MKWGQRNPDGRFKTRPLRGSQRRLPTVERIPREAPPPVAR